MKPIFHLSFPVRDLEEAISFYVERLKGAVGRRTPHWADVALFGAQLTLQERPEDLAGAPSRSRHFGATLSWDAWKALIAGLTDFVEPPRRRHVGTEREEAKAMIADPSGNLIELKAYRTPHAVLGALATVEG